MEIENVGLINVVVLGEKCSVITPSQKLYRMRQASGEKEKKKSYKNSTL